jgi:HSP20 family molecular chaperone IbpA
MPVRYQRFTYRYLQGRRRPAETAFEQVWLTGVQPAPISSTRRPPVDVWETVNSVVVKVMMPGVSEDNVKAILYDDVLVVNGTRADEAGGEERRFHRAEIHYGELEATVLLPVPVDPDGVEATCRQGVVMIRLAKRGASASQGERA